MRSLLSALFALAALCSSAVAQAPADLASSIELDTEQSTHSRALLGGCSTKPFAQCGGRGSGGKSDGVWSCCPSGYSCSKYNEYWYSCQKAAPQPKPKACSTKPFAQCGGWGSGGKAAGVWSCCPAGYACTKYNKDWYSCQKAVSSRRSLTAAQKRAIAKKKALIARKKAIAKKKAALAKKKAAANKRKKTNRRTGTSNTTPSTVLSGYNGYQNPQEYPGPNPACHNVEQETKDGSQHWCGRVAVTGKPKSSRAGVVVGRQTIFNGPPWTQVGYCAKRLWPTDSPDAPVNSHDWREKYVKVALSTKYMKRIVEWGKWQWPCDAKICMRVIGYDETMNPHVNDALWRKYVGMTMQGIVYDKCGECDDEHVDILSSYPYTEAPTNEGKGAEHNRIWPKNHVWSNGHVAKLQEIYGIGIVKIEWGWNPLGENCDNYF